MKFTTSLILAGTMCCAASASAQQYPTRPVRMIVGFAPGGGTDIVARVIGQKLSEWWGQQVIVENRAGATGTIGADVVAKAPADGYILLMGHVNSNAIVIVTPDTSFAVGRSSGRREMIAADRGSPSIIATSVE